MKLRYVLIGLCALVLSVAGCDGANVPAVNVKQVAAMQAQGALLLDVRQPDEYTEVRAPNSMLLPLDLLQSRVGEIAQYKDKMVAVICRSGRRSTRAVQQLQAAGFSLAVNVEGGMNSWEAAGLLVERGAPAR
ncbi:MAG: rhodanese-like domain-containing protein [Sideroxydans sp.]